MTPATFPRVANFNSVDLRTVGKAYLLNSFFTFVKRNSPAPFHLSPRAATFASFSIRNGRLNYFAN